MSTQDTKPAFGATVIPTDTNYFPNTHLQTDSPALTPAGSNEDMAEAYHTSPPPIHSPFYQHPPASFERVTHSRQQSLQKITINTQNEKDIEAQHATHPLTATYTAHSNELNPFSSKISLDHNKECKMWPSRNTLMQSKMADKRRKRATRVLGPLRGKVEDVWHGCSKKQKLSAKVVVAVIVCGIMVAIGVGITNAVHGGVWSGDSKNTQIGDDPNS